MSKKRRRHWTFVIPADHVNLRGVDEACRLADKAGYVFQAAIPGAGVTVLIFVRDDQ